MIIKRTSEKKNKSLNHDNQNYKVQSIDIDQVHLGRMYSPLADPISPIK